MGLEYWIDTQEMGVTSSWQDDEIIEEIEEKNISFFTRGDGRLYFTSMKACDRAHAIVLRILKNAKK